MHSYLTFGQEDAYSWIQLTQSMSSSRMRWRRLCVFYPPAALLGTGEQQGTSYSDVKKHHRFGTKAEFRHVVTKRFKTEIHFTSSIPRIRNLPEAFKNLDKMLFYEAYTKEKSVMYPIIFSVQNEVSVEMRKACQKNQQFGG